jgi:hypothetical protein
MVIAVPDDALQDSIFKSMPVLVSTREKVSLYKIGTKLFVEPCRCPETFVACALVLRTNKPTGLLLHPRIVEIHDTIGRQAIGEFSGKSARDIILLNRPKWSGDETPQPSNVARRVSIPRDNARAENDQSFEAGNSNRFFF